MSEEAPDATNRDTIPISNLTVVGGPHTADLVTSAMNAYHDPREAPVRVMIDEPTMRLWFGERVAD